jgi:PAS domain S-box-containing protein
MPLGDVNGLSREAIETLPAAVYMTDAEGRITFYNEAAAVLWGCRPDLRESKFSGAWKLYWPDGTPLPHDECPMAMVLRQKRPIPGMEAVAERPDGTRIAVIPHPTPLFDADGRLTGAVNILVDVNERRQAEEALAEREAQLAVFVEHAPAAIAMFDREMRYLAVSRRFVVDYLPPGTQLIGQSHYEVFPNIPQRWRDVHARVLAGEDVSQHQDQYTRYDGRTDWVRWSMAPWRRANGDVGGALLFAEIITEQVEARRELAESEMRFRATFESTAVGVVLVDPNGTFLRVNDSFSRMLGYTTHELKTKSFLDLTHPDDLDASLSVLKKGIAGEANSYYIEKRYLRRDGGIVWANLNVSCVRKADGAVDYFVSVIEDITERKEAEEKLRKSERTIRELLGALPAAVYVTDAAGRITYYNQAAVELWGKTPELGKDRWSDLARPYCADGNPAKLANCPTEIALRYGKSVRGLEAILERTDGTRIPVLPYPTPLRNAAGAIVGVVNMTVDISKRQKAERTLAERNLQLALAAKAALVGSYAYDVKTGMLQFSEGYAAIYDLPEGANEMTGSQRRALVHPEDLERLDSVRRQAFEQRRGEFSIVYRNILPKHGVRWIESRSLIFYGSNGQPERLVGVNIDVTERKRMEQALTDRDRQLKLAGKAALVGSFAIDIDAAQGDFTSQRIQFSPGFAAIYDLPEETVEVTVGDLRSLVHPDDLPQYLEYRQQICAERRGEHHAEFRIVRPFGTIRWIETRSFIEYDHAGHARRVVGVNIDITERKRAEEARKILNAELDHRVKNALATVTAVISHTQQGSRSVADFAAALEGRIRSMATTHELLSSRHWQELSLIELIRRELAPYAASKNTEISGPTVLLKPEAGQALAMVFHELATNAAKYGALSNNKGRVLIRWDRRLNGHPLSNLVLEWREVGGPWVVAPGKTSYGTSTINDLIPYELGGTVDLVFAPEGVRCRLELPADWLTNMGETKVAVADTAR